MIPSRRMLLAALAPAALALATIADGTLLWPMLACDAALALVAAIDGLFGWRRVVTVERQAPRVFSLGRDNPVTLELRSTARRTLAVRVTDDLFEGASVLGLPATVTVPPRGTATLRYPVRPSRRGGYELGDHHLRWSTPLGLWERQARIPARQPVKVYPDVKSLRSWDLLARDDREYALLRATRLRGGESEFERLREYQKDDEFRSIDWKATARRQKLIAREYQIERNQSLVFLLDAGRLMTAESDGLSLFDHALNATLMLSHVAARGGDRVGMMAFDDRPRAFLAPGGGPRTSQRIARSGYALHPRLVETDFHAAFAELAVRVRGRALLVLFTQVIDERGAREVGRLLRAQLPRHLPLVALLRDTEIDRLAEPAGGGALDLYRSAAAAEHLKWRDGLLREMRAHGVLVLDVAPARLTPSLISRYLAIKARRLL